MSLLTVKREIQALKRRSLQKLKEIARRSRNHFRPPPLLKVSEWADGKRRLSPESSAEPGQWYTARTPYLQEIMDAVTEPRIKTVVFIKPTQVGGTEALLNILGYYIDQDPCPILYIMPTLDMARAMSRERLAPMLRDSPCLQGKVSDAKTRNSENATLQKMFPGGHLAIAGANSAASLASRPRRILLCDEEDLYPTSAGTEGDPTSLALKRLQTYWNRKDVHAGKLGDKLTSRLEPLYKRSDMRKFYVPCPACGKFQVLSWVQVKWEKKKPETAYYLCKFCTHHWTDPEKIKALSKGKWKARRKLKDIAGFWINGLYSPWLTWEIMAKDAEEAENDIQKKKVWVTSFLAETWEEAGLILEPKALMENREGYGPKLPRGVLILTAGVDVQDDRLELEVMGWGEDEETWGIETKQILGSPGLKSTWDQLDQALEKKYAHELGIELYVASACVDSGGHYTQQVYKYCRTRQGRGIYAVKGSSTPGRPIINRAKKLRMRNIELLIIGTDSAKDLIYRRMAKEKPGPEFMHFSKRTDSGYDEEYFKQLTAEKVILQYRNGFPYREWIKIRPRNEALDIRVYAVAAFYRLSPNLKKYAEYIQRLANEKPDSTEGDEPARPAGSSPRPPLNRGPRKPGRGWVNSWR